MRYPTVAEALETYRRIIEQTGGLTEFGILVHWNLLLLNLV
jgi:hypothetical protein